MVFVTKKNKSIEIGQERKTSKGEGKKGEKSKAKAKCDKLLSP